MRIFLVLTFISGIAWANTDLNKTHRGQEVEGTKVNCVYCHTKAGIPKAPAPDAKKNNLCKKCH